MRAGVLCVEPLRDLFTAEVRQIGRYLGMPEDILSCQAVPATGLALNIAGEITPQRLDLLRTADRIFRRLVKEGGQTRKLSAFFSTLEPAPGGYSVTLHALTASDIGQSRAARIPYDILESAVEQIHEACPGVIRVTYDLTPNSTV